MPSQAHHLWPHSEYNPLGLEMEDRTEGEKLPWVSVILRCLFHLVILRSVMWEDCFPHITDEKREVQRFVTCKKHKQLTGWQAAESFKAEWAWHQGSKRDSDRMTDGWSTERSQEYTKCKDGINEHSKGRLWAALDLWSRVGGQRVPLSKARLSLCLNIISKRQQEAQSRPSSQAGHGKEGCDFTGDIGVITVNLSPKDDPWAAVHSAFSYLPQEKMTPPPLRRLSFLQRKEEKGQRKCRLSSNREDLKHLSGLQEPPRVPNVTSPQDIFLFLWQSLI